MKSEELTDRLREIIKKSRTFVAFGYGSGGTYNFERANGYKLHIRQTQGSRLVLFGKKIGCCCCSVEELSDIIDLIEEC